MLKEYEKYHGTVLRALVASSQEALNIGVDDIHGRINGYVINQKVGIYIKHSSKRLTPWNYTFTEEHLSELAYLSGKYKQLFAVFVCGPDGLACLPYAKLIEIGTKTDTGQLSIGIARSRNQMYEIYGATRSLDRKIAVGVRAILDALGIATASPEVDAPADELAMA
jgi:hypothetical protein